MKYLHNAKIEKSGIFSFYSFLFFKNYFSFYISNPGIPPFASHPHLSPFHSSSTPQRGKTFLRESTRSGIPTLVGPSPSSSVKAEQRMQPEGMSSKKSVHAPGRGPDVTARPTDQAI